jgi:Ser-tRNA(Ala) deacylase AlaX
MLCERDSNSRVCSQLEEGISKLAEQDEVELEVTFNRRTGARRARTIRLLERRELGQVHAVA